MSLRLELVTEAARQALLLAFLSLPKQRSIDLIGDKLGLSRAERVAVERIVRWPGEAIAAAVKKVPPEAVVGREIGIDGYNVIITVEAMLMGEPVFLCSDGFLRDLRGVFSSYKPSEVTFDALKEIAEALKEVSPRRVVIAFDEPMSRSGELAAMTRQILSEFNLTGDSLTHKQVDTFVASHEVAASSDVAVIEKARCVLDLPELIAKRRGFTPKVIW